MSEKIYRLLLRLYPAQFRRTYGEEALQLFRDRLHDETGGIRRIRLWFDLLADLGMVLVRGYRESPVVRVTSSVQQGLERIPSFQSIEAGALDSRAFFMGGIAALIVCGVVILGLQYGGAHLPFTHAIFRSNYQPASEPDKARPKIAFSYSPADPSKGATVRLDVVVIPNGRGPIPTGKVNFFYGWSFLKKGTLENGSATVYATVPDGAKLPLNAIYLGDNNYNSASSFLKEDRLAWVK